MIYNIIFNENRVLLFFSHWISTTNNCNTNLHEHRRSKVLVSVPPVGWTRRRTASTQNALVESVQLLTVGHILQVLCCAGFGFIPKKTTTYETISKTSSGSYKFHLWLILSLQPRLNGSVLRVEVGHVRHQIPNDIHMGQRIDLLRLAAVFIDATDAGQRVGSADVHRAWSANTFAARSSESECRIDFVFDL